MRRLILLFLAAFLLPIKVYAIIPSSDYLINHFNSQIEVEQDTSLSITETIAVEFFVPKHGIFRIIPVIYSAGGKTINANLKIISITDENNLPYQYEISRFNQSVKIKIGDPDKTISGKKIYIIKYQINKVLLRYPEHDEIYWNVTGSEWDTTIETVSAEINSSFAPITKIECFGCQSEFSSDKARFSGKQGLTVVVALDKNGQLKFPGPIKRRIYLVTDNWGYLAALFPFVFMFFFWYQKGRDQRYFSDNVYYQPDDKRTKLVSLFERPHLPLVYSPISGLTPAEVGTIIDQKVDIQDVIAEIVELARLDFLEIKKTEKDYLFIRKQKATANLKNYQEYLLNSIFGVKDKVRLSDLKNKFYQYLNKFREKLYQGLDKEIFDGNPEKVKSAWIGIFAGISLPCFIASVFFAAFTVNPGPILINLLATLPGIMLAIQMPRRTAWGYSLFRQTVGLRWYLKVGKWRQEIAEKRLFFEEILPLAIALGVVKKLVKDMAALGVKPPTYFVGINNLNHFSRQTANSLVSSPGDQWSGKSSWSGSSGFSGGSSGSGFGGGGGGSW